MKALEKAAKDREDTGAEQAPAAQAGGATPGHSELTLEPITAERAAAPLTNAREPALAPPAPASSPRKPPGTAPVAPTAAAAPAQAAQAATVLRAGQRPPARGGVGTYVRDHPLIMIAAFTALLLAGYGGYIYLQLTNPGVFTKQPPRTAQPAPPPVTQAPAIEGGINPAAPIETASLLPTLQDAAEKGKPAAAGGATAAATPAPATTPAAAPGPAGAAAAAVPAPVETAPATPRDTIVVTASDAAPVINPLLTEAYTALAAGNLESSQRLYNQLLRSEPNNIDALLGLAAIATQQGDTSAATRQYQKILELDPRNSLAQAGLIGMFGRADPMSAETRLKQLIARDPSAYLYFTLGNVHADRSLWAQAQQAYFQAHHLQPDNPDYAYNLAVALEHIGQPKPALDYYRRAVQFAAAKGRANFGIAAAQERIKKLEKIAP